MSNQKNQDEQQFTIQPHPAKTNDPSDLINSDNPGSSGGLFSENPASIPKTGGPGLQVLSDEQVKGLEKPKSREELKAEAAKFNN